MRFHPHHHRPHCGPADPLGHTAYHHVGADCGGLERPLRLAAVAASAYHGYRRNNSAWSAIGWALAANLFPVVTLAIAAAEGLGKRKGS